MPSANYEFRLPLLKGGVNFDYLPRRREPEKIKKREWKYGAKAGLLKRGAGGGCMRVGKLSQIP